ncbi:unnamed protein product [Nesidiocoris tenuis]|uniref:Uncharacterized protein n=1 Tax=Nesidiocoris tenuis TaxID=355587 RepID=A0A6H5H1X0_9HEMI|nr:unnamed protein product [Nesidiocoris tenuis]
MEVKLRFWYRLSRRIPVLLKEAPCPSRGRSLSLPRALTIAPSDGLHRFLGRSLSLPRTVSIAPNYGLYRSQLRSLSLPITVSIAPNDAPVYAAYRSLGRCLSLPLTLPITPSDAPSDAHHRSLGRSPSLPRTLPIAPSDGLYCSQRRSLSLPMKVSIAPNEGLYCSQLRPLSLPSRSHSRKTMLSMLEGFRKPKKKPTKKRAPSFRVYRETSVAPPPIHHYSNSYNKQLQQSTANNYNKRSAAARALRELHIRARKARALSRPPLGQLELVTIGTDQLSEGSGVKFITGKPQKQTVQVSIQPFSSTSIAASRKSHLNKLLEDEDPKPVVNGSIAKENIKKSAQKLEMDSKPVRNEVKCMGKEVLVRGLTETEEFCMPNIKTIVIETKREERGTPEGRKTHIQRGSIVTKAHEQVKNKLIVQKNDKRGAVDGKNDENDAKTIIISVEDKNEKNILETKKIDCADKIETQPEEVTVKVLKLLNGQNGPPESREMAGEPDGKADSDEHEQELTITPPPRSSFLHKTDILQISTMEKPPKPLPAFASTPEPKNKPPPPPPYQSELKPPPRPTSLLGLTKNAPEAKADVKTTPEVKISSDVRKSPDIKMSPKVRTAFDVRTSPELRTTPEVRASPQPRTSPNSKIESPTIESKKITRQNGTPPDAKKQFNFAGSSPVENKKNNSISPEVKKSIISRSSPVAIKKMEIVNGEVKNTWTPKAKLWTPTDPISTWSPPQPKITRTPEVKIVEAPAKISVDVSQTQADDTKPQNDSKSPPERKLSPVKWTPEPKNVDEPKTAQNPAESKNSWSPSGLKSSSDSKNSGSLPEIADSAGTDVNSSTYEPIECQADKNGETSEFYDEIDMSAEDSKNHEYDPVETKNEVKNSSTVPLNGSMPDVLTIPDKPKLSSFDAKPKVSSIFSASCPDVKNAKNGSLEAAKTSRASAVFNSISSEFKSFKSFLSSSGDSKKGLHGLPPTPLTLARGASPAPALPSTPPPSSTTSGSSPGQSPTSEMSSFVPPSSSPPSSLSSSPSSLESSPPPQPNSPAPSLVLRSSGSLPASAVSLPTLGPLQINTAQLGPPLTPSDDVPVLEVYARKRPAPKPPVESTPPEPLPRRRNSGETSSGHGTEKKKTRVRQTLRKLLRFGSREEDGNQVPPAVPSKGSVDEPPPTVPRPRPHIIHPLDLNKSAVQVLPASGEKSSPDSSTCSSSSIYANSSIVSSVISSSSVSSRPSKPPPPPRSESLNLMERLRPRDSPNPADTVYVNLGEGRCGITPVKPQRTGSLRGESAAAQKSPKMTMTFQDSEHVYEAVGVSSAPEKPPKTKAHQQSINAESIYEDTEIYYPYVTFQLTAKKLEVPTAIRSASLDWSSFRIPEGSDRFELNGLTFVDGSFDGSDVTLVVSDDDVPLPTDLPNFWTKFDSVVPSGDETDDRSREVVVLKRSTVERFVCFARNLEKTVDGVREGVLVLLQIVRSLAELQSSAPGEGSVHGDDFVVFTTRGSSGNHRTAVYLARAIQVISNVKIAIFNHVLKYKNSRKIRQLV